MTPTPTPDLADATEAEQKLVHLIFGPRPPHISIEQWRLNLRAIAPHIREHMANELAPTLDALAQTRENLYAGLDRSRDDITTPHLATVAVNALANARDALAKSEAANATLRQACEKARNDLADFVVKLPLLDPLRYHPDGVKMRLNEALAATNAGQSLLDELARLRAENQRLTDLVRYQRSELHQADLISDKEYEQLLGVEGSPARLEGYDAMRNRLTTLRQAGERLAEATVDVDEAFEEVDRRHDAIMSGDMCRCGDDPDNCKRCSQSMRLSSFIDTKRRTIDAALAAWREIAKEVSHE